MITLSLTTHGLFLVGHGTAALVAANDPSALASAIRRIVGSPMPKLYPDPPAARPSWAKPLFAERDAEDRRRIALAEDRAALRDRIVRARARRLVEA